MANLSERYEWMVQAWLKGETARVLDLVCIMTPEQAGIFWLNLAQKMKTSGQRLETLMILDVRGRTK